MLQGLLLLSWLPGGMGTRFQSFKSLVARRSIQPAESFCKALWLSSGSAAGAQTTAAKSATQNPIAYSFFTNITLSPLVGGTNSIRSLCVRAFLDDRVKHSYLLPVPLV